MDLTLASAADPVLAGFDDIIDVRAPAEYAEDHLPGAINLPVLSDAERARVGTIYKQVSPFDARKLGAALVALLRGLNVEAARTMPDEMSFAGAFAIAAHHWHVPPHQALEGLLWTYAEGQVAAATRLVPLGQTAAQRILIAAAEVIPAVAAVSRTLGNDEIGNVASSLAMVSAWHEVQYSRLFQS